MKNKKQTKQKHALIATMGSIAGLFIMLMFLVVVPTVRQGQAQTNPYGGVDYPSVETFTAAEGVRIFHGSDYDPDKTIFEVGENVNFRAQYKGGFTSIGWMFDTVYAQGEDELFTWEFGDEAMTTSTGMRTSGIPAYYFGNTQHTYTTPGVYRVYVRFALSNNSNDRWYKDFTIVGSATDLDEQTGTETYCNKYGEACTYNDLGQFTPHRLSVRTEGNKTSFTKGQKVTFFANYYPGNVPSGGGGETYGASECAPCNVGCYSPLSCTEPSVPHASLYCTRLGLSGANTCAELSTEPFCGDGICDRPNEGPRNCSADCESGPVCGDGLCAIPAEIETCPQDCGHAGGACDPCDSALDCNFGVGCFLYIIEGTNAATKFCGESRTWVQEHCSIGGGIPLPGNLDDMSPLLASPGVNDQFAKIIPGGGGGGLPPLCNLAPDGICQLECINDPDCGTGLNRNTNDSPGTTGEDGPLTFLWDFGDGTTGASPNMGTEENPSSMIEHTFVASGDFTVTATLNQYLASAGNVNYITEQLPLSVGSSGGGSLLQDLQAYSLRQQSSLPVFTQLPSSVLSTGGGGIPLPPEMSQLHPSAGTQVLLFQVTNKDGISKDSIAVTIGGQDVDPILTGMSNGYLVMIGIPQDMTDRELLVTIKATTLVGADAQLQFVILNPLHPSLDDFNQLLSYQVNVLFNLFAPTIQVANVSNIWSVLSSWGNSITVGLINLLI